MTPQAFYDGPRTKIVALASAKHAVSLPFADLEAWNAAAQPAWEEVCRFIRRPAARKRRAYDDLASLMSLMLSLTEIVTNLTASDMEALGWEITRTKNPDYAGTEDFALNFVETGRRSGIRAGQVWLVYADKHWCSVTNFVKAGKVESEDIRFRIADVYNYCALLAGMITAEVV